MKFGKIIKEVSLSKNEWCIISFKENRKYCSYIYQKLKVAGCFLGIDVEEPVIITEKLSYIDDIIKLLQKLSDYKIIIVIINEVNYNWYKDIKSFLNCQKGIPSQVIIKYNLKKCPQFLSLLKQIIIKIGGTLYKLNYDLPEYSMIIGIKVKKTPKGKKYFMSSAYDDDHSIIYTADKESNEENKYILKELLLKCFNNFEKYNNRRPSCIMVLRKGNNCEYIKVSEFNPLLEFLKEWIMIGYLDYNFKYCFIFIEEIKDNIFYSKNEFSWAADDAYIVDKDIVCSNEFIILNGNKKNYNCSIFFNNTGLNIYKIGELIFKMHFSFWSKLGNSYIPFILKYVEKACHFDKINNGEINESIRNKQFYI